MNDQEQQQSPEAATAISFACASCAKKLKAPSKLGGTTIKCPACGEQINVPPNPAANPAPEPSSEPPAPVPSGNRFSSKTKWWLGAAAVVVVGVAIFLATRSSKNFGFEFERQSYLEVPLGSFPVDGVAESGFYFPEDDKGGPFRWTDGHAKLVIPLNNKKLPQALHVELLVRRPPPLTANVQILVNQREIIRQDPITQEKWARTMDLSGFDLGEEVTVEIVSNTFVPKGLMGGKAKNDTRKLGVQVRAVELLPASDATTERVRASNAPGEPRAAGQPTVDVRTTGIQSGAITRDGKTLVTGDFEGDVYIWDVVTRQSRNRFHGILPGLQKLAINSDGTRIAVSKSDGLILILDEKGHQLKPSIKNAAEVTGMAFSPDGKTLAAAGGVRGGVGELKLWNVETGSERVMVEPFKLRLEGVAYAPDGQKAAVAGGDGTAYVIDVQTGKVAASFVQNSPIVSQVAFSGDSKWLAVACSKTGDLQIFDLADRKRVAGNQGNWGNITGLEFAPNSRRLRITSGDGLTTVWDVTDAGLRFVSTLKNPMGNPVFATFVQNGDTVLTGSNDGKNLIWSIKPAPIDAAVAAPSAKQQFDFIDLQSKANAVIDSYLPENAKLLAGQGKLPKGKSSFGGVPFNVGDLLIQLGGKKMPKMPPRVDGIAVQATAANVHFLHAACYNAGHDDELIGTYVVNYEDKSKAAIDIVYRQDVRDWYCVPDKKDVARGKNVWTGYNAKATSMGRTVCLFLTSWKNPEPAKRITSIDYISTMTDAAPFCVAITLVRE